MNSAAAALIYAPSLPDSPEGGQEAHRQWDHVAPLCRPGLLRAPIPTRQQKDSMRPPHVCFSSSCPVLSHHHTFVTILKSSAFFQMICTELTRCSWLSSAVFLLLNTHSTARPSSHPSWSPSRTRRSPSWPTRSPSLWFDGRSLRTPARSGGLPPAQRQRHELLIWTQSSAA